jgi:hypothetical protein
MTLPAGSGFPLQNPDDPAHNTNQRLPTLSLPGTYPYVRMYQFRDGSWWRQDETPGAEHYSRGHISGTFYEQTVLGGTKSLSTQDGHHYSARLTTTVDSNHHNKVGGSEVHQMTQDTFSEHGGDKIHAVGGAHTALSGGLHFSYAQSGTQVASSGDDVSDHNDGNHHHNVLGDAVKYIGGTKYESIGGEYGIHIPAGNMDIKIDNGQCQITCGSNITINSMTAITLNVGSSSILITPNKITITSAAVAIKNS